MASSSVERDVTTRRRRRPASESKEEPWDFYVDHDSSPSNSGSDESKKKKLPRNPDWLGGIWVLEAGPSDGNWASFDTLCVLSASPNAGAYMAGRKDLDMSGFPVNPNPADRFYGGSLTDYATKGPVPKAATETLGYCGVRRWPGCDETDGFIRYVAGVAVERTARSMLFVCVDVALHGPITEDTLPKLESMQAFDWYRRKNGTRKTTAASEDKDLVPIAKFSEQLQAAEKLDKSLMLISRRGFAFYDIVAWNETFAKVAQAHGFLAPNDDVKNKLALKVETRSTGEADWIETEKKTLVVFAWLSQDDEEEISSSKKKKKKKRAKTEDDDDYTSTTTIRPLPMLLEAVDNDKKEQGPGLFCVRLVAEEHYAKVLPTAMWLWFPPHDAAYLSDSALRTERPLPHKFSSWLNSFQESERAQIQEALETTTESGGSVPFRTRIATNASSPVSEELWQGSPLLWTKDKASLLLMVGCLVSKEDSVATSRYRRPPQRPLAGPPDGEGGTLAAAVYTEMTAPLGALRGSLEHIWDCRSDDIVSKTLHDVLTNAVDRLESTFSDAMDLARLGNDLGLNPSPTSLHQLLTEIWELEKSSASEKRVALAEPEIPGDFPRIMLDHARFGQIYSNCLSHAVKLTLPGASVRTVVLATSDTSFQLRVLDCGPGLDRDDWDTVFDTSIALALSRKLAALHGGKIFVRRHHNGTMICLDLEMKSLAQAPAYSETVSSDAPSQQQPQEQQQIIREDGDARLRLRLRSALVVDEDRANRTLLALHLKKLNPDVVLTFDAGDATLDNYDFVFVDLRLSATLLEAATTTRGPSSSTPKIVGMTDDADPKTAGRDGVLALLTKPCSSAQLRDTLNEILDLEQESDRQSSSILSRSFQSAAALLARSPSREGCAMS